MRILFWITAILSFLCLSFATIIYFGVHDGQNGAGMAMIFFLPLAAISLFTGAIAMFIRFTKKETLTYLERMIGLVLMVLLLISMAAGLLFLES